MITQAYTFLVDNTITSIRNFSIITRIRNTTIWTNIAWKPCIVQRYVNHHHRCYLNLTVTRRKWRPRASLYSHHHLRHNKSGKWQLFQHFLMTSANIPIVSMTTRAIRVAPTIVISIVVRQIRLSRGAGEISYRVSLLRSDAIWYLLFIINVVTNVFVL